MRNCTKRKRFGQTERKTISTSKLIWSGLVCFPFFIGENRALNRV